MNIRFLELLLAELLNDPMLANTDYRIVIATRLRNARIASALQDG